MALISTVVGILLLVMLISYGKVYPFVAFLLVTVAIGLALGMKPIELMQSVQAGIGSTLSSIVGIIALGAMLGKLIAVSGAAQQISEKMIAWIGTSHIRWAFMLTGFLVGLPLFYSVGFMILVPLAITVAHRIGQSAIYIGLPLLASLSVTQGYLPPHPAPLYLVHQLHADMGLTLFYGILISVPAILLSGALYGSTVKGYTTPPNLSFVAPEMPAAALPGTGVSFVAVLLPIILIAISTIAVAVLPDNHALIPFFQFIGDPTISLLMAVVFASVALGTYRGQSSSDISRYFADAVKDVAGLILIFGGAGALKQVLSDGGVSSLIATYLQGANMNPYVLGWSIAAIIRVCVGSSTVSGITTAGFIAPLMAHQPVNPNLMVLSIGAGSMMFSHVNDTGFWLFREYFQLSMKDTLKTWSVMDTLVSVTGLLGVLALAWLV